MTTATTIANQLGRAALYMIGAKQLIADGNALRFKIMRNDSKINMIHIALTDADLYDVTYYNFRNLELTPIAVDHGIYADMLCASIRTNTGLATNL